MATKTTATRKIDWPMVALYLGTGILLVYALEHVPWERLADLPAEKVALVASAIVSALTAIIGMFRGKLAETVATVPVTVPIAEAAAPVRERSTPPDPTGPTLALLLACACAPVLTGCGAGALGAHARASIVLGTAVEGADALALTGAEIAMATCASLPGTVDERIACTHEVERVTGAIDVVVEAVKLAVTIYQRSVEIALAAGETGGDIVGALFVTLVRIVGGWTRLVALAAEIDVVLPSLPPSVLTLAGGS